MQRLSMVLVFLSGFVVSAAALAGERVLLNYDVVWGGMKVFSMDMSVLTGNRRYVIDMKGETRGLASLFSGGRVEVSSEGRLTKSGPMPQLYNNIGRWGGDDFRTTLFYNRQGQFLTKTQVRPKKWEEKYKREPVPEDMQQGADPISLLTHILQNTYDYAAHGPDNPVTLRAFDGRRVLEYRLECGSEFETLKKTSRSVYHGDARVCRAEFEVVAGKIIPTPELEKEWEEERKKAEKRRREEEEDGDMPDDNRLKIWVADPDGRGMELPVRAAVKTGLGTARMYLSSYNRFNFPARVAARVIDPSYCTKEIEGQSRYC